MIYRGRYVDVLALWGELVDLPSDVGDPLPMYLPKVRCPNPDHDTHKQHFQINAKKPFVHCFAKCGISGTYEHAIATILGVTEKQARQHILKFSRVAVPGEVSAYTGLGTRKTISSDDAIAKDQRALDGGSFTFLPKSARGFLDDRGVDGPSRGKWQIGWDEDAERLVIPVYDERRIFRFLIRQRIDGISRAKYLYTDGSIRTNVLFGACYLDAERVQSTGLILCEGPLDAIRLHQLGFANAVAVLGSGISKKQSRLIEKIGPKRVYLFFDRDAAGVGYIEDAKESIHKRPLFVCRYRNGKTDPAEMTREEVARSIDRAVPVHEFYRKARSLRLTRKVAHVG